MIFLIDRIKPLVYQVGNAIEFMERGNIRVDISIELQNDKEN